MTLPSLRGMGKGSKTEDAEAKIFKPVCALRCLTALVNDQNQVLVSGIVTRVDFWYRCWS